MINNQGKAKSSSLIVQGYIPLCEFIITWHTVKENTFKISCYIMIHFQYELNHIHKIFTNCCQNTFVTHFCYIIFSKYKLLSDKFVFDLSICPVTGSRSGTSNWGIFSTFFFAISILLTYITLFSLSAISFLSISWYFGITCLKYIFLLPWASFFFPVITTHYSFILFFYELCSAAKVNYTDIECNESNLWS